jgi:glycosyltransferase involved in cell wall biosynthesis
MKLGVVTTSYPRWPGDLAGNFVGAHVAWLARRHPVTVIAAGAAGARDGRSRGAHVVRVPDRGGLFYGGGAPDTLDARAVTGTAAAIRFTAALAATVRREGRGWDAVACHWLAPSALVAAPLTRGPMLAIAHSGDVHVLERRGLLGPTIATLVARGVRLVFVAPDLLERSRAAVPRPLRARVDRAALVHPMGIDVTRFAGLAVARVGRRRGDVARVAVIGRLVPVKGIDVLLDALAAIAVPVELSIAGDGPARPALEARAAAAPARHRIRFLGAVSPERRDALLADADLLIAPSIVLPGGRTEGTPTAVLEAIAAAVPVVASDVGGLSAMPAAWVHRVPAADPRALAAAITAALADDAAQRRADAAARAAVVLDWPVVARRLHDHWFGAA